VDGHDDSERARRATEDPDREAMRLLRDQIRAEPDGPFTPGRQAQLDAWVAQRAADKEAALALERQVAQAAAEAFGTTHDLPADQVLRMTDEDRAEYAAQAAQPAPAEET
jgi:hypothetical protein